LQSNGRFGLSRSNNAKRAALQNGGGSPGGGPAAPDAANGGAILAPDGTGMDFNTKLLHLAWHPEANLIAAAASNSLYMYYAR
jgi:serine/threonine-protein phosphatase 2A regulatory subunit B